MNVSLVATVLFKILLPLCKRDGRPQKYNYSKKQYWLQGKISLVNRWLI